MFSLRKKTVNQRKNEIICTHVVDECTGPDKAVKVLYHPTIIYSIIEVEILEVTSKGLCGCDLKEIVGIFKWYLQSKDLTSNTH